ncbi:hypothetical protein TIFTF001_002635 [Ficus carica]|uniref:Uncharacterized protein n=1 Tax=Ficus carica TaxID=3494 RepID=A0AA88CPU4_FICCA|nr:hypothetical protein TIFTF001_002635 [Ficus carica]
MEPPPPQTIETSTKSLQMEEDVVLVVMTARGAALIIYAVTGRSWT